jgi:hypothetical protein
LENWEALPILTNLSVVAFGAEKTNHCLVMYKTMPSQFVKEGTLIGLDVETLTAQSHRAVDVLIKSLTDTFQAPRRAEVVR